MIVQYILAGRVILTSTEPESPRVDDEVNIEGKPYRVGRLVRHLPGCPPDWVNAHLVMAESERIWPAGHP